MIANNPQKNIKQRMGIMIFVIVICIIISLIVWYSFNTTEKFFKEPFGKPHYDKRYFVRAHSHKEIQDKLRIMYCVLIKFLDKHNVKCWLAFGTLLGYYRDKDIIPWDDDIAVGMRYDDLYKLPKTRNTRYNAYV